MKSIVVTAKLSFRTFSKSKQKRKYSTPTPDEIITSLQAEIAKLKSQISNLNKKIMKLETQNVKLEKKNLKLEQENLKLKRRNDPLPPTMTC
jgi:predicted nuclease with TOPRIM domain